MNEKIITFLNSGLLEKYLLGETSSEETEHIESYIARHPEVEHAYNTLQFNLEVVAKTNAVEAPRNILNNILEELDEKPVIQLNTTKKYKKWHQFSIAASLVALIFAGQAYYLHNKNQKLSEENQVVVDEIFDLRSDIEMNNKKLDDIMHQFKQLNDPETYKYIMQGNNRAKNLKTVAYINPKEKTSMIDVVALPQLPQDKCYQIWAELQGKMVSLGILNETDRQLRAIPYTENALGLNITIEPKGGNTVASLENSVAKIQLK
jgi:anti-sigma-K factor RskA